MSKPRRINDPMEHVTPDELEKRGIASYITWPQEDQRDWLHRHPFISTLLLALIGGGVMLAVFLMGGY